MRLFFSPSGRLARNPFLIAVLVVYAAGFASQLLTASPVASRFSVLPFCFAQLVLLWAWYVLHRKRLRDAQRSSAIVGVAAIVYLLALAVVVIVIAALMASGSASEDKVPASSIFGLYMLLWVFGVFGDRPTVGTVDLYVFGLLALTLLPLILVAVSTLWAATRGSAP